MRHYRPESIAAKARWHRKLAIELTEIGKLTLAADQLARAEMYENELHGRKFCRHCGRALKDDESLDSGYGPDCRKKLSGLDD